MNIQTKNIDPCSHAWRKLYEQFLLGGAFPIGWECVKCGKFVGNSELTPEGLDGVVLEHSARVIGPHGGCGQTSDGRLYKEQIVSEDGSLEIVYAEQEGDASV